MDVCLSVWMSAVQVCKHTRMNVSAFSWGLVRMYVVPYFFNWRAGACTQLVATYVSTSVHVVAVARYVGRVSRWVGR